MKFVDFLRARFDEDAERQSISSDGWRILNPDAWHQQDCNRLPKEGFYDGDCDCGVPDRVRADVEAKRAVIALYEAAESQVARGKEMDWPHSNHQAAAVAYGDVLKLYAVSFDTHPDYREEWRP